MGCAYHSVCNINQCGRFALPTSLSTTVLVSVFPWGFQETNLMLLPWDSPSDVWRQCFRVPLRLCLPRINSPTHFQTPDGKQELMLYTLRFSSCCVVRGFRKGDGMNDKPAPAGKSWYLDHACMHAQSYPTLCNLMDCSPPGSSVHGILQERLLEWVTISYSRGSSRPKDRARVSSIF